MGSGSGRGDVIEPRTCLQVIPSQEDQSHASLLGWITSSDLPLKDYQK